MTQRRTPSGTPIPPNANFNGRPPRSIDYLHPDAVRFFMHPGLVQKLELALEYGELTEEQVADFVTDLRQFRRAENGDRERPGEYLGRDDLPTEPMPFAARATHRPDRQPGTPTHRVMKAALDQIDADTMTADLRRQMARHETGTTWDRADPNYRAPADDTDRSPPSLRESIEAASSLDYGSNQEG